MNKQNEERMDHQYTDEQNEDHPENQKTRKDQEQAEKKQAGRRDSNDLESRSDNPQAIAGAGAVNAAVVDLSRTTLRDQAPAAIRQLCRSGAWSGPTAGLAQDHVQANLMILPREAAYDFLLFCQRNPKPCPLIEVVDAGSVTPLCTAGGDLRFDLPGYRIYEQGELREETGDIAAWWRDDLVSFLLGCSFSFERALIDGGVPLRHVDQGRNVAMYKTNIACQPAGRFAGNMVVSMRPVHCSLVPRAVTISARYPQVHGAPVHVGDPATIGIADLARPDFGDAVDIRDDELPVFWACGVTPQYVAQLARIPFCISHSPGKMLVTDFKTE